MNLTGPAAGRTLNRDGKTQTRLSMVDGSGWVRVERWVRLAGNYFCIDTTANIAMPIAPRPIRKAVTAQERRKNDSHSSLRRHQSSHVKDEGVRKQKNPIRMRPSPMEESNKGKKISTET